MTLTPSNENVATPGTAQIMAPEGPSTLSGDDALASPPVNERLAWRYWMVRQAPGRLPGVILVVAFAGVSINLLYHAVIPAAVAALLLLGSVSEYLLPMRCRLSPVGASVETLTGRHAIAWESVRRVARTSNGLLLSPLERPSRSDSFRGVTVRFAAPGQPGDRTSVLDFVQRHATSARYALPEERSSSDTSGA